MTWVENKNQSTKEQINSKVESKEQKNASFAQAITEKAFKEFSIDEKRAIAILINKYLKLPKAIEPRELFQKLLEIKKNNLNNSKLSQIIIDQLKQKISKKENDLKALQIIREKKKINGRNPLLKQQVWEKNAMEINKITEGNKQNYRRKQK